MSNATAPLLFEIGTEELPPTAINTLATALAEQLSSQLKTAQLQPSQAKCFSSPRRLAVLFDQVLTQQPEQNIEQKGPSCKAAYDQSGNPTKALLGFARSCGVEPEQLTTVSTPKGEWLYYYAQKPGQPLTQLFPSMIKEVLAKLPMPKAMRWASFDQSFIRPVHWLLAILGEQVIPFNLFGCDSGRQTYGHRVHGLGPITITEAGSYAQQLQHSGFVMANFAERRNCIAEQAQEQARRIDGKALMPDALLTEVTNLVEWPVALLCQFDRAFLSVPQEALICSMQSHQKSFAVVDANDQLQPYFITIANIDSKQPEQVIAGNQKVMSARLADARFFYEQDQKTPLADHLPALESVAFQQKLGSLAAKAKRLERLATVIGTTINGGHTTELARAGLLAKTDLMTQMVMEFPELQGTMGYYYALATGESKIVAQAIGDHYKPRFASDEIPSSPTSAALALADKIDTLVGIFAIGKKPTGTKDPFGLRRAAIGVIRIIINNGLTIALRGILTQAISAYGQGFDADAISSTVLTYIKERLHFCYQEQGVAKAIIEAVLTKSNDDLTDIDHRIAAVGQFMAMEEASRLAAANKRVQNILSKHKPKPGQTIDPKLFNCEHEHQLHQALQQTASQIEPAYQQARYTDYLQQLAKLATPINDFFAHVMVMADNSEIRQNRLLLLAYSHRLFTKVADISCLAVTSK